MAADLDEKQVLFQQRRQATEELCAPVYAARKAREGNHDKCGSFVIEYLSYIVCHWSCGNIMYHCHL